ncbi:MAG: L,D-transpeptidase [Candidatus Aenigmatarchaeota archaeon]
MLKQVENKSNNHNSIKFDNLSLGINVFNIAEKEYYKKLGIDFSKFNYALFIDGDNQRAYVLKRNSDANYEHQKISNDKGQQFDYFRISSALLGFSPIKINGSTPTGFFIASLNPKEGALINPGKSVGNSLETRSMWSYYLPLYGKEEENKGTQTRSIGLHGSSLYQSVAKQNPESHGCIRFFAKGTRIEKTQYKDEPKIEDLLQYLTNGRIPVFIFVSKKERVNKQVRNLYSYLPKLSTEIVNKALQTQQFQQTEQLSNSTLIVKPTKANKTSELNIPVQIPEEIK